MQPEMILFDYGQTLINEKPFDGERGYAALMPHVVENPRNITVSQLAQLAVQARSEMGHDRPERRIETPVEVYHPIFQHFLFEYTQLKLSLTPQQIETMFWDAASPPSVAPGIEEVLRYIKQKGIRSAVVSNITFSRSTLAERINKLLPQNEFEFFVASSEYVFRKPSRFIFEIALQKAGAKPENTWFCGDNFICDICGAGNMGCFPVWYSHGKTAPQEVDFSYATINHWSEFLPLLEAEGR